MKETNNLAKQIYKKFASAFNNYNLPLNSWWLRDDLWSRGLVHSLEYPFSQNVTAWRLIRYVLFPEGEIVWNLVYDFQMSNWLHVCFGRNRGSSIVLDTKPSHGVFPNLATMGRALNRPLALRRSIRGSISSFRNDFEKKKRALCLVIAFVTWRYVTLRYVTLCCVT